MPVEGDLPSGHQRDGHGQEAPRIDMLHKEERREHHGIVPVIDPAGAAALVLHEPCLEGTEEQDADNIADEV